MGPRRALTMVNRQCKGSSPGPGGPQPCPHTKPRQSPLSCTFILASAKLTFLPFRHSFPDSTHSLLGLPAGQFPTHSPLYIRLTNRLSFILSICPNHLNILSFILSFTPFFTPHHSLIRSFLTLLILFTPSMPLRSVSYTHLRAHETPEHLVCRLLLEKKKKQEAD